MPKGRQRSSVRGAARAEAARPTKPGAQPVPAEASPVPSDAGKREPTGRPKETRASRVRRVPPILFEGDEAPTAAVGGPGEKFALGPKPPATVSSLNAAPETLPATYGTRRIWLAARDPHWLYAAWDLSGEELQELEARAVAGHLTLRVYERAMGPTPLYEIPLARAARSWFVHVDRSGVPYLAELGYADTGIGWRSLLTSEIVSTPPDAPATAAAAEFTTIPVDVPFAVILAKVAEAARKEEPLAQVLETLRGRGFDELPDPAAVRAPTWTPAQERALAAVLRVDAAPRVWLSSLDVTASVARELSRDLPAGRRAEGAREQPSSPQAAFAAGAPGGISSPAGELGAGARPRGFWFNVNAELVIYGATEPDAQVTVAGRAVKLRRDGSFSLRFALPDGDYELPVVALAKAGDDGRSAELRFRRLTQYYGQVGAHPQDARLKPPRADAITAEGPNAPT